MAIACTSATNWGFNYLVSSIFLQVTSGPLGKVFVYMIMAIICLLTFFFVLRFVPETLGRTNDECVKLVQETKYGMNPQVN